MASYDNTYSRFISWAKVLLPIAALTILSTIFLVSRNVDPTASIPFAQVDVEQLLRDQGISAPVYSTLSGEGTAVTFKAARVLPTQGEEDGGQAEDVQLSLEYPDGLKVNVVSNQAIMSDGGQVARLQGEVEITTSEGYVMTTDALLADIQGAWLRSDTQVVENGPFGNLVAETMEIKESGGDPTTHVVDFKDGVKLLYTPQPDEDAQ